ncbi:MAG: response regulator, partial [Solirubrobacterales bacterium]|nr:response regulator [Solirubrobacterales bacterium]
MASKGHILVVDDERAIRRLLRMYLSDAGFTVAEAADGDQALEQVRRG